MARKTTFVPLQKKLEEKQVGLCLFCGVEFEKARPFQKFCSTEHQQKYWFALHPRVRHEVPLEKQRERE